MDDEPHARFRDVVTEWYRYQDELLGRLLAKIDLETTAVFILSDHGFKSGERRIRSEQTIDVNKAHLDHETHGIFIAAGPHIRRGAQVGTLSVIDMTPTLLHYLGFPVGEDMAGGVLESVFLPEFMNENPVRTIASFEDGAAATPAAPEEPLDDSQVAANLEALEALGYLGGSSDDPAASAGATEESSPQLHTNMGRIHLASGELDKAQAEFEKALALDPNYADALLNIGEVHRFQGKLAQAEHFVERAIAVDPNSIGALAQLAELKRTRASSTRRSVSSRRPCRSTTPFPSSSWGWATSCSGPAASPEAERAFASVLELDPDAFKAHYNLGVTYGNMGRLDEAIAAYETSIELAPQHPESGMAHNNLGAIHQARGEVDQAQARYEQAVALSPYHLESRYNLAVIYLARDRAEEAIGLLEQAAALQPNHEVVSTRLGWAYLRVGRNQDAYRSLLLVRRLYPGNWEANLGLALLHAASGNQEEAKALPRRRATAGGRSGAKSGGGLPGAARVALT